jgi:hypothetical protein
MAKSAECKCESSFTCGYCLRNAKPWHYTLSNGSAIVGGPADRFKSEYEEATAETQLWRECSEEDYMYGLECLPPAYWEGSKFMVGEAWTHNSQGVPTYRAFFQRGDKYFRAEQPMTRSEFRKVNIHEVKT